MKVGGTKRERVAEDGFFYTQDYEGTGGKKYFKCSLKSSKKCKGRGVLDNGVFRKTKPHNHAPNAATCSTCRNAQKEPKKLWSPCKR